MHERYLVCSVARFGVGSNAGMIWVPVTIPAPGQPRHSDQEPMTSGPAQRTDILRPRPYASKGPVAVIVTSLHHGSRADRPAEGEVDQETFRQALAKECRRRELRYDLGTPYCHRATTFRAR